MGTTKPLRALIILKTPILSTYIFVNLMKYQTPVMFIIFSD